MAAPKYSPQYPENVTGKFKGTVSDRAFFSTREIDHDADATHCQIAANAQPRSRQSKRKIEFLLDRSINTGTYTFAQSSAGPVSQVRYYEASRDGPTYNLYAGKVVGSGTLVIEVSANKEHYSGKLTFTSVSRKDLSVDIDVDFNVYLPAEPAKH